MGATEILAEARAAGVSLLVEEDGIRVEPRSALSPELRARIIAEKPAILALVRVQEARHRRFRTTPEGAVPLEVRTLPEATLAEAGRLWPNATVKPLPAVAHALGPADESQHGALLTLVERVARAYWTPPDELAEMKRLALADPAAALAAFTATATADGLG